MRASERDRTAPAVVLVLPGEFAAWLVSNGMTCGPEPTADLFHASARAAMAAGRRLPGGDLEVSCDVGGLCVIGEQAYNLAHEPGISDPLMDAAILTLDRFHSAMDEWNGTEGMCVDCGGGGTAPRGGECAQCHGSGRVPTGW